MNKFVLDCSITMSWFFSDEVSEHSIQIMEKVLAGRGFVPAIWPFEVVNVLLVNERRKRLQKSECPWILEKLDKMPISIDNSPPDKNKLLSLAREEQLSSYDAAYLELALRLKLPLATNDKVLKTAAAGRGLVLIED